MINVNKLKGKIVENGINVETLAERIGVDPSSVYRKLKKGGENFSIKEVNAIVLTLGLSKDEASEIFFSNNVANMRQNNSIE